ncbi:hypothetical protein [Desulfomonile tiedjei]|uniref:Uncharacterized protein n=1 Tax=Desulfomonile tiedjei (strain ATCC 49306 / DSM 6799 / DCB-1) TaxID=706587 RepID=I4C8U4_DESTA|nr:hypothetical protein [Desulfomonile tiedjei]AFM25985.1 hypothetical protein Desti_3327 [Desulfomonile tiedjei DSM 6799]
MKQLARYTGMSLPEHRKLSRMIRKESESMAISKHMFDTEHPDNGKNMSREQIMRIAKNKIIQQLSAPLCAFDEKDRDEL